MQQGTPDPFTSGALPYCELTVERDGQLYASEPLRIPGYGRGRVAEGRRPVPESVAHGLSDPSAVFSDGRLWLANGSPHAAVAVNSAKWDDPRKLVWDIAHRLGTGHDPSIVADATAGLFIAYVERPKRTEHTAPGCGPAALHHSADGKQWEALPSPTRGGEAHSVALAVDSARGLCLVYTAAGETGRPLVAVRSADFGQTWGEPVMLTEPTVYASLPKALCYNGALYVAYREVAEPPTAEQGRQREGEPPGIYTLVLDPAALPAAEASTTSPIAPSVQQRR